MRISHTSILSIPSQPQWTVQQPWCVVVCVVFCLTGRAIVVSVPVVFFFNVFCQSKHLYGCTFRSMYYKYTDDTPDDSSHLQSNVLSLRTANINAISSTYIPSQRTTDITTFHLSYITAIRSPDVAS